MRKDKEKVLDEVWTEDHVKSFLNFRSYNDTDEDFHILLKAYQSMRAEDFELFVGFFLGEDRNINARNRDGHSVLAIVGEHSLGAPYAAILTEHGAV